MMALGEKDWLPNQLVQVMGCARFLICRTSAVVYSFRVLSGLN